MWGYIAVFYLGFFLGMFLMAVFASAGREDNDVELALERLKKEENSHR